jgi:hypothetical protein
MAASGLPAPNTARTAFSGDLPVHGSEIGLSLPERRRLLLGQPRAPIVEANHVVHFVAQARDRLEKLIVDVPPAG